MNYLPYVGYWFYGGTTAAETASFASSWGLLDAAPAPPAVSGYLRGLYHAGLSLVTGLIRIV